MHTQNHLKQVIYAVTINRFWASSQFVNWNTHSWGMGILTFKKWVGSLSKEILQPDPDYAVQAVDNIGVW